MRQSYHGLIVLGASTSLSSSPAFLSLKTPLSLPNLPVASIDWETGSVFPFFNPRTDAWGDHFALVGAEILGQTPTGIVTARIFGFNQVDRVLERALLIEGRRYPSLPGLARMQSRSE